LNIEQPRFNGGLASFMSERQQSPYESIARSWLALVERRQRNFVELCTTGRWRHYYTRAQLIDEVRKVLHLRAEWARLADVPVSEQIDLQQSNKAIGTSKMPADEAQSCRRTLRWASGACPRRQSWPPWRGVSNALDLKALNPYPMVLFKNMTSTRAPLRLNARP